MKRLKNNPLTVICLLPSFGATALIAFETVPAEPPSSTIQACYNDTKGQ